MFNILVGSPHHVIVTNGTAIRMGYTQDVLQSNTLLAAAIVSRPPPNTCLSPGPLRNFSAITSFSTSSTSRVEENQDAWAAAADPHLALRLHHHLLPTRTPSRAPNMTSPTRLKQR